MPDPASSDPSAQESEAETGSGPPGRSRYRRVLLKLSGEALMGGREFGIDPAMVRRVAEETRRVLAVGVQVCIVVGGGNLFRGINATSAGLERSAADHMGMLATVMNALAMQGACESLGLHTRVQSAIPMQTVCEPYVRRRALRHMEKGRVVIFAAGTGNPYFTTDTAAALRASEMNCDVLLKGTQVDGVYDSDPKQNPAARRYDRLTYHEVLTRDLRVMDHSAIALTRENGIPIAVFSIHRPGAFAELVQGRGQHTMIAEK